MDPVEIGEDAADEKLAEFRRAGVVIVAIARGASLAKPERAAVVDGTGIPIIARGAVERPARA
jgi:hypothetical protein